jgi:hypothetical protein
MHQAGLPSRSRVRGKKNVGPMYVPIRLGVACMPVECGAGCCRHCDVMWEGRSWDIVSSEMRLERLVWSGLVWSGVFCFNKANDARSIYFAFLLSFCLSVCLSSTPTLPFFLLSWVL